MKFAARRVLPDPAVWGASSFASAADYTVALTEQDRQELLTALRRIEAEGRLTPTHELTPGDFKLGPLAERLRQAFLEVRDGRGFVLLRGGKDIGAWIERPDALATWYRANRNSIERGELLQRKTAWYQWDRGTSSMAEIVALAEKR